MKNQFNFQLFLFFVIIFFGGAPLNAQNKLSLSGDRYSYTIRNNANIHLKVTHSKTKETNLLSPNETWTQYGNFGKGHFRKTKLVCKYDIAAYTIDKELYEHQNSTQLSQAERILSSNLASNDNALLIQFGLIAGSNIQTNYDDWAITKLFKWGIRESSELALKGIDFYNAISDLQSIQSEDDLFDYLEENYGFEARLKQEIIEGIDFLNYKSKKRGINAVINWAEAIEDSHDNYDKLVTAITNEYENNISYINGIFQAGKVHTYSLNQLSTGTISFKTKTPAVTLSLSPLHYGNSFNEDWRTPKELLLSDKDGDDEYDFEDGLWNRTIAGKIQFAISPEMRLGKNSQARLLFGASYLKTAYSFETRGRYSPNFFSEVSTTDSLNIMGSETLDDQRISAELAYKMYLGRTFTLEFTGGLSQVENFINYKSASLVNGFTWAQSRIDLAEKYFSPYYGVNLGIGKNKFHKGTHLIVGCKFFEFNNLNLSDTYNFLNADTEESISFKPQQKWNYRINIGLAVGF